MAATKTVHVTHLGGIDVGYEMPAPYDPAKPTVVLINSMCTTVNLFRPQFASPRLASGYNLLAIEPLGHGATTSEVEHFTYWDSAAMSLQVLDALGIKSVFALGTGHGGWIVVRMALLQPDRIEGLIPLGCSMDYESSLSRTKGCWEPASAIGPFVELFSSAVPTPEWVIDDALCGMVASVGFGARASADEVAYWTKTLKEVYRGDAGRKKARMAVINLMDRDGLLSRLRDIRCPVLWMQGTEDIPFGYEYPKEQVKLFVNSPEVQFEVIQGGGSYLSATSPKEVEAFLVPFLQKYQKA